MFCMHLFASRIGTLNRANVFGLHFPARVVLHCGHITFYVFLSCHVSAQHTGSKCTALQAILLGYLALVRPYFEWQLQWVEVFCAALEMGVFVCAMLLMGSAVDATATTWAMIGVLGAMTAILLATSYRLMSRLFE